MGMSWARGFKWTVELVGLERRRSRWWMSSGEPERACAGLGDENPNHCLHTVHRDSTDLRRPAAKAPHENSDGDQLLNSWGGYDGEVKAAPTLSTALTVTRCARATPKKLRSLKP